MDNFIKVTDANQLNKIFENAQDKLIILMFFVKNAECRRALPFFEKAAMNNNISIFCLIDMDKFEGESRYITNATNMPKFDCFYMGNSIGTVSVSTEKEINQFVMYCQQYMMQYNNSKNNMNSSMSQFQGQNNMPMMNQMQPINIMQLKQQILNSIQMQNPQYYQYLMNNPMALQQLVQQQLQTMQQNQVLQQQQLLQQQMMMQQPVQTVPAIQPIQTIQPPAQTQTQFPMNNINLPVLSPTITPTASVQLTNQAAALLDTSSAANSVLPTLQQMQHMFRIFQMMQQMGVLHTPVNINQNSQNPSNTNTETTTDPKFTMHSSPVLPPTPPPVNSPQQDPDNTIILSNGDKLIPLENGKYGLIKAN